MTKADMKGQREETSDSDSWIAVRGPWRRNEPFRWTPWGYKLNPEIAEAVLEEYPAADGLLATREEAVQLERVAAAKGTMWHARLYATLPRARHLADDQGVDIYEAIGAAEIAVDNDKKASFDRLATPGPYRPEGGRPRRSKVLDADILAAFRALPPTVQKSAKRAAELLHPAFAQVSVRTLRDRIGRLNKDL
jgi:hypothetical protein